MEANDMTTLPSSPTSSTAAKQSRLEPHVVKAITLSGYDALAPRCAVAAPPSDLWFIVYNVDELLDCIGERQTIGITYDGKRCGYVDAVPMSNEALFMACAREHDSRYREQIDLFRILVPAPVEPPIQIREKIGLREQVTCISTTFSDIGVRWLTSPVSIEHWYGIDQFVNGTWCRTNLLGSMVTTAMTYCSRSVTALVTKLKERQEQHTSELRALCSDATMAEGRYIAAINALERRLDASQAQVDQVHSQNMTLIRDIDHLTDDDWCLTEMMDLKARLDAEELNKALAEEKAVKALRHTDEGKRYISYLQRLLRKSGIPFNPIIGHGNGNQSDKAA